MRIEEKQVKKYLRSVKELKEGYAFYDMHVHPFELIFSQFEYQVNPDVPGLYSVNGATYTPPKLHTLQWKQAFNDKAQPDQWRDKIFSIMIRKLYGHTGPKVLGEHMKLSGTDKVLLLPVAPPFGEMEPQMEAITTIFGNDKRFLIGCSIPNSVKNEELDHYVKTMFDQYKIQAVKLHPNVTEMDLASNDGKERVEMILSTCGKYGLPLVVHGGRSTILKNPETAAYGSIDNLESINWGISGETVIIAHAGAYAYNLKEAEQEVFPRLKKMLSRHDNLMVDISALDIESLIFVLKNIDVEKILFGSDALYVSQWASIVKLWCALLKTMPNINEAFIQIAGRNPLRCFNKDTAPYTQTRQ